MMEERFRKLERWGVPVCFGLAFVVHFLYGWTNYALWAGLVGAANESVWEHAKLLILPYALWSVVEFAAAKPPLKRFAVAKAAGFAAMLGAMIGFYYLYTLFTGGPVLAVDIISVLAWGLLGFFVSSKLMRQPKADAWFTVSVFALVLLAVMVISFTVNPPRVGLFQDPVTGGFGLYAHAESTMIPV